MKDRDSYLWDRAKNNKCFLLSALADLTNLNLINTHLELKSMLSKLETYLKMLLTRTMRTQICLYILINIKTLTWLSILLLITPCKMKILDIYLVVTPNCNATYRNRMKQTNACRKQQITMWIILYMVTINMDKVVF